MSSQKGIAQLLTTPVIQALPGDTGNVFTGKEAEHLRLSATLTLTPPASGTDAKLSLLVRPPPQSPSTDQSLWAVTSVHAI